VQADLVSSRSPCVPPKGVDEPGLGQILHDPVDVVARHADLPRQRLRRPVAAVIGTLAHAIAGKPSDRAGGARLTP